MKLSLLCDAIFEAREMQFSNFDDDVLKVLSQTNDDFVSFKSEANILRLDKLSRKIRKIIVILHMFPVELKIAMTERSYGSVLRDFLALYLNVKAFLSNSQKDSDTLMFINEAIREVFLILKGIDDEASIWMVLAKSLIFENTDFLQAIIDVSFDKTHRMQYTFEQYISLVGVLYKYFSVDQNAKLSLVTKTITHIHPPKGIAKYLTHHFPHYNWGDSSDTDVHKTLFIEAQPKSFVCDLAKKICLQDFEDLNYVGCDKLVLDAHDKNDFGNGAPRTDEVEAVNSEEEKYEKEAMNESKVSRKSRKKKKKKRANEELRESTPKKPASGEKSVLEAFYAGVAMKDPIIVLQRIRV